MAILSPAKKDAPALTFMEGEYCIFPRTHEDRASHIVTDPAENLLRFIQTVNKLKEMSDIRPAMIKKYSQPHSIKRPTSVMVKKLIKGIANEV